jgi:membrane protein
MAEAAEPHASTPWAVPPGGWLDVLKRSWGEMGRDHLTLIAAGVAFYGFTALVPLLAAVVLTYGLVAEPAAALRQIQALTQSLPADAAGLIRDQLRTIVSTEAGKSGLGLVVALAIALWGASRSAGAIVTALNIAYGEEEGRGFLRLTLLNLAIVLGAVLGIVAAGAAVAALSQLDRLVPAAPPLLVGIGRLLSWLVLAGLAAAAAATLYRYGPDRPSGRWTWLTPGSVAASLGIGLVTFGFSVYVANFASYNATYGSLGAVVVLLTWLYLSVLVLLLGAELNAELERPAAR